MQICPKYARTDYFGRQKTTQGEWFFCFCLLHKKRGPSLRALLFIRGKNPYAFAAEAPFAMLYTTKPKPILLMASAML